MLDWNFFNEVSEISSGDFYKYLDFNEEVHPEIGPRELVRFYRKPAGTELRINPNHTNSYITLQDKENYLQEVLKQAREGLKLTSQTAESVLKEKELFICCVRRDNKFDSDPGNPLSLLRLIPNQGTFLIYGWAER